MWNVNHGGDPNIAEVTFVRRMLWGNITRDLLVNWTTLPGYSCVKCRLLWPKYIDVQEESSGEKFLQTWQVDIWIQNISKCIL